MQEASLATMMRRASILVKVNTAAFRILEHLLIKMTSTSSKRKSKQGAEGNRFSHDRESQTHHKGKVLLPSGIPHNYHQPLRKLKIMVYFWEVALRT